LGGEKKMNTNEPIQRETHEYLVEFEAIQSMKNHKSQISFLSKLSPIVIEDSNEDRIINLESPLESKNNL
jgi:hypothetical protein